MMKTENDRETFELNLKYLENTHTHSGVHLHYLPPFAV